jgi:hypothetical protein
LARADEPNRFWDKVCELNQVAFVVGPDEEPSLEAGALLGAAVVVAAAVVGLDVVDVVLTGSCSLRQSIRTGVPSRTTFSHCIDVDGLGDDRRRWPIRVVDVGADGIDGPDCAEA